MPDSPRDRPGFITAGDIKYTVYLRGDRPSPYRPLYQLVWPTSQDIPGQEGKVAGDPNVREWHIDEWAGGEGEDLWEPGNQYDISTNVQPKPVGDGIVLGARQITTQDDAPATFTEGRRFGLAQGKLWTVRDASAHWWQPATGDWDATGWATGGSTDTPTSLIDLDDGATLAIGYSGSPQQVRLVTTSTNVSMEFDISSSVFRSTLGTASFDFTGGGVEDEWTFAAHGLAVGQQVYFSAAGAAPAEYAADTRYWVVAVPDANTFQLSATEGGAVLAGTADDTGTWTLEKYRFTYPPVLRNWGGSFFLLNGDDVYSFTLSSNTATFTLRGDNSGRSDDYLSTSGHEVFNRISTSDKGPIWFQRMDNGETFIFEWNVNSATKSTLAKLPVDFATPYSVFFANGFYFVAFRYGSAHDQPGDAYLFAFRGSQRTTPGPIRAPSGTSTSKPVLLAGMMGDDLIMQYDNAVWAYNQTFGGINQVADSALSPDGSATECVTFGQNVFLANPAGSFNVERYDRTAYTTRTATLDSGRYDFGYPGILKALMTVTVVTEPLPAATSVSLAYSADGGSFTTLASTTEVDRVHDLDSATSFTWTVSTAAAPVTGTDFELRLILATTNTANTPTIRSVTARAVGVERIRTHTIEVDTLTRNFAEGATEGSEVLANLKTINEYNGLVKLEHAWDREIHDDLIAYEGVVTIAELVDAGDSIEAVPVIRLRESAHV